MKLSLLSIGAVIPSQEENWKEYIPKHLKRRTPKVWQMSNIAVSRALQNSPKHPTAIVSAAALGALNETVNFFNKFSETGLGSPKHFIASVHNSTAGKIAVDFKIKGTNLSLCDSHTSLSSAISTTALLQDEIILLIISEEHMEILDEIYREIGVEVSQDGPKEGSIALVLSTKTVPDTIQISATPPTPCTISQKEDPTFFDAAISLYEAAIQQKECTIKSYSESTQASSIISVSHT